MVLIDIGLEKPLYVNETYLHNITIMRSMVYHDRDMVLLIAGRTGTGKSVLAMQTCKLLDPTFDISRIVYKGQDLINLANSLPKYSAIMLDESRESLSTEKAFDERSKKMLDYLNEVRHRNLYIVMLMPDYWEYRTHLATQRSHAFVHVYELENPDFVPTDKRSDPMMRGYADFYDFEQKRTLYYMNKKSRSYRGVKPSFRLDFSNTYVIEEAAYRRLKDVTTNKYSDDDKPEEPFDPHVLKTRKPNYVLVAHVVRKLSERFPDMKFTEIADIAGCGIGQVRTFYDNFVPVGKKAYKMIAQLKEEV